MFSKKKKYNELSDLELIKAYRAASDMGAVGELFQRYSHLVASIAFGILKNEESAKETAQEIFEVIIKDLKKHEVKNFNAWIFSVTKFHCFKKKKKKLIVSESLEIEEKEDFEENLEQELLLQKRVNILKKALNKLKTNQKQCVELFYFEGLSYLEIVEQTQFSLKEVKSSIQNGKRNLKNMIYNSEQQ